MSIATAVARVVIVFFNSGTMSSSSSNRNIISMLVQNFISFRVPKLQVESLAVYLC